jgi:hypothetical protein
VQDRDERLALDELHDEEGQLLVAGVVDGLAVVVDRGDVRMREGGRVPGLVAETGQEVRITRVLAAEHLGRDDPVENPVARLPHLAHPAGGDRGGDLVPVGQQAAGGERHQPPCPSR